MYDIKAAGLKVHGKSGDQVLCTCPFHRDAHPSFSINQVSGVYYCFSCKESGFIKTLAEKLGGVVSFTGNNDTQTLAPEEIPWRNYLTAPLADDSAYLKGRNVSEGQVEKYGILSLPNGVGFPLKNRKGEVTGIAIRQYKGFPRYLYLGEKPDVYPRVDFSLEKEVVVTEGIFGMLNVERAGLPSITTLTALVSEKHRLALQQITPTFFFDDDYAGYLGAAKALQLNPLGSVVIPGGEVDEMKRKEILKRINERTNDIQELARRSNDEERFWRTLRKYKRFA